MMQYFGAYKGREPSIPRPEPPVWRKSPDRTVAFRRITLIAHRYLSTESAVLTVN